MRLSLQMSPDALHSIRGIRGDDARRGIKKIIEEIQENPVERSTGFSFGMLCCDGFLAVGKMSYAYEIDYEHDASILMVHRVSVTIPGPH